MEKFLAAVRNMFSVPDLRRRILFTLSMLAIYRLGGYHEESDGVANAFDGPSVVFHPAGANHADDLETADPAARSQDHVRAIL